MSAQQQGPPAEAGSREEAQIQELRAALDTLEAKLRAERKSHNEELRQFAYTISHDLREPIRMVTSYTQLLDRRYEAQIGDEGREFMRFILDGVQRMDQLLSDLLTYSHQFSTTEQPRSLVDAEGALQGALLNLDKPIRESGAEITYDPMPSLHIDFSQLSQLFRQLISNAIKFRGVEAPRIHLSTAEEGDFITFAVRDNGIGIDPRYHEQIYGIFKRLHGREYPGTGIGLAICKRIAEQNGGKIWIESQAGQGATFRFVLPR